MEYFIQQCQAAIGYDGGLLISLFIGGVVGSIGHCTGMCGPIVMAQAGASNVGASAGMTLALARSSALLPYHLGRIVTYSFLGLIGAAMSQYIIGSAMQQKVASAMLLVAGILFMLQALPVGSVKMLSKSKTIDRIMKHYGYLVSHIAAPFSRTNKGGNLFFFGIMLGFLPCGLVMAAVMAVASTGDPALAAAGMAVFGLGTIPTLVFVGLGAGYAGSRWPRGMQKITRTIMAMNGFILCAVAVRLAV